MLLVFLPTVLQAAGSVVFALCSPDLDSVQDFTYINNCFPTKAGGADHNPDPHHFQGSEKFTKVLRITYTYCRKLQLSTT